MSKIPSIDEAREILRKYNTEMFHLKHAETVAGVMRCFAQEFDAENVDFWEVVGLLHDVDFEMWPDEHCVKGEDVLRENGVDESIIRSTMSHGWGLTGAKYEPEHIMEKVLFAVDELTGLIGAAALMRPSKSVQDMEVSSVKKKFKDKKFAAGCSRDVIAEGAERLGWTMEDLMVRTLEAMKEIDKKV